MSLLLIIIFVAGELKAEYTEYWSQTTVNNWFARGLPAINGLCKETALIPPLQCHWQLPEQLHGLPGVSGGSKNFERGGGRKTIYQLRPHLSQMCTTKYMPFTRKKRFKKCEPTGGPSPFWICHCLESPVMSVARLLGSCINSIHHHHHHHHHHFSSSRNSVHSSHSNNSITRNLVGLK